MVENRNENMDERSPILYAINAERNIRDVKYDKNNFNVTFSDGKKNWSIMVPKVSVLSTGKDSRGTERANILLNKTNYDVSVFNRENRQLDNIQNVKPEQIVNMYVKAKKKLKQQLKEQNSWKKPKDGVNIKNMNINYPEDSKENPEIVQGVLRDNGTIMSFSVNPMDPENSINLYAKDINDASDVVDVIRKLGDGTEEIENEIKKKVKVYLRQAEPAEESVQTDEIKEAVPDDKSSVNLSVEIDWSGFGKEKYLHMMEGIVTNSLQDQEILGQIRIGDMAFNLVVVYEEEGKVGIVHNDEILGKAVSKYNNFEFDLKSCTSYENFKSKAGLDLATYVFQNSVNKETNSLESKLQMAEKQMNHGVVRSGEAVKDEKNR